MAAIARLNRIAGMARSHSHFPGLLLKACVALLACAAFSTQLLAQQQPSSGSRAEVTSLCNPDKVESAEIGGNTTYTCEGKRPTPRSGAASKYKAARSPRADINCSYSDRGDKSEWMGCNCTADEDSKCTGFIFWCASQGEDVSGNSSAASCSPGR